MRFLLLGGISVASFTSLLAFVSITSWFSGYGKAQQEYVADPITFGMHANEDFPGLIELQARSKFTAAK